MKPTRASDTGAANADPAKTRVLRSALWANATFSAVSGLILLLGTSSIAALLGVEFQLPLQIIGIGLVLFAGDLVHQATRPNPNLLRAQITSLNDFGWVAGTVVVLVGWGNQLSSAGVMTLIAVAVVVASFGALQLHGVRRVSSRATVSA